MSRGSQPSHLGSHLVAGWGAEEWGEGEEASVGREGGGKEEGGKGVVVTELLHTYQNSPNAPSGPLGHVIFFRSFKFKFLPTWPNDKPFRSVCFRIAFSSPVQRLVSSG